MIKNLIISIVSKFAFLYRFLPKKYYYNYDIFTKCLSNNENIMRHVNIVLVTFYEICDRIIPCGENLLDDIYVCRELLLENFYCYEYFNYDMKCIWEFIEMALEVNLENAKYLPKKFVENLDDSNYKRLVNIVLTSEFPYGYEYLPKRIKYDRNFILEFTKKEGILDYKIPRNLKNDIEVSKAICKCNCKNIRYIDNRFKSDGNFILSLFETTDVDDIIFKYCNKKIFYDVDFVKQFVYKYTYINSKYLNRITRDNKDIMLALCKFSSIFYSNASNRLKGDVDIIKAVGGRCIDDVNEYLPKKYRYNKDLLFKLMNYNNVFISCFKPLLKNRNFVKEIVQTNGLSLKYLTNYSNDFEICKLAVQQNCRTLKYVSSYMNFEQYLELFKILLSEDKDLVFFDYMTFIEQHERLFTQDKFLELLAVNGNILQFINDLKDNKEAVLIAVKSNGNSYIFASQNLKKDKDIALVALQDKNAEGVAFFLDKQLCYDLDVIDAMIAQDGKNIRFLPSNIFLTNEMVNKAIENNPLAFRYLPQVFRGKKDIILKAVENLGLLLKYAEFFDEEICEIAVNNNCEAIKYVPGYVSNFKDLWTKALLENISLLYHCDLIDDDLFFITLVDKISDGQASYTMEKFVDELEDFEYSLGNKYIVLKILNETYIPFENLSNNLQESKDVFYKLLDYKPVLYFKNIYFQNDNDIIIKTLDKDFSLLSEMDINYFDEEVCEFIIDKFATYEISKNYDFEELSIIPQEFVEVIYNCVKENIHSFSN